jgi:uncharacterized membrane protein YphA (DoxX/SURF4 family)
MNISSLILLQSVAGAFFAISGYHKLANKERHAALVSTLESDHVPLVRMNQWFVPAVEMSAGIALTMAYGPAAIVAPLAAALLLAICVVATCVDGFKRIAEYQPIDKADWLDDLLYLPEVLLAVILVVIVAEHI